MAANLFRTVSRRRFLRAAGLAAVARAVPVRAAEAAEVTDVVWSRGPRLPRPVKGQAQGVLGGRIVYAGGFAFDTTGYTRPPASATRDEVNRARSPRTIRYSRETWLFDPAARKFERLPDAPVGAFWPEGVAAGDAFYLLTGSMRQPARGYRGERRGRVLRRQVPFGNFQAGPHAGAGGQRHVPRASNAR